MQFATGTGIGKYKTNANYGSTVNFVDFNTPNSTLTVGSGAFPQRTFTQGNIVPAMYLNYTASTSKKQYIYSFSSRFALAATTAGNDLGNITISLSTGDLGWQGNATIQLQGSFERYSDDWRDWITLGSSYTVVPTQTTSDLITTSVTVASTSGAPSTGQISIAGSLGPVVFSYTGTTATSFTGLTYISGNHTVNNAISANAQVTVLNIATITDTSDDQTIIYQITADNMLPCYRLLATLNSTGSSDGGYINWTVSNMFIDLSAELVGSNATNTNGSIGQEAIQVNSSIPFGRETSWVGNTGNTGNNQTEIGTMFTPGGML